jgi:hypothetical protein
MNMAMDMCEILITLLSKLVRGKDEDATDRLIAQENALEGLVCTAPELGKWIDACDFPFLIETLMLNEAIFIEEFPDVRLTAEERKQFANTLELHSEACERCHSKRSNDLEWQSTVNRAFAENKEVIGEAIGRSNGKG